MSQNLDTSGSYPAPIAILASVPESDDTIHRPPTELRRMLFISYAFAPTGGGGVQRSVKFTKYLAQYGWRATVLTVANPSVPVRDGDLDEEPDPSTEVLRARTLEPSYSLKQKLSDSHKQRFGTSIRAFLRRAGMQLLQPDPQVLWNPAAIRLASDALHRGQFEAIYATGPPFSSFLLGRLLKKRFGLPLILDFRDEWLLASRYFENYQLGRLASWRQRSMLNRVLRAADAVITTTQASAEEITRLARQTGSQTSVTCIYNGYDHDDIGRVKPAPAATCKLRIVYTGTLWKLTDISPFVAALTRVAALSENAAQRIELVLAGRRVPEQAAILKRLESTPISVRNHDYVPHRTSLEIAASADLLLLLLADQPGAERVVPAKLFEYLALGKSILAICPPGEVTQLLEDHGRGGRFAPSDTERIARWIIARTHRGSTASGESCLDGDAELPASNLEPFSRRALTGELAQILDSVTPKAFRRQTQE